MILDYFINVSLVVFFTLNILNYVMYRFFMLNLLNYLVHKFFRIELPIYLFILAIILMFVLISNLWIYGVLYLIIIITKISLLWNRDPEKDLNTMRNFVTELNKIKSENSDGNNPEAKESANAILQSMEKLETIKITKITRFILFLLGVSGYITYFRIIFY